MTLDQPLNIQMAATLDIWRSIISKRSCFIAQHDLWMPVIKEYEKLPGALDSHILPCSDTYCPFSTDAELRYTDADPGNPCPKYTRMHSKVVPLNKVDSLRAECQGRPFWEKLL